jgi:hypothetical protein
MDGWIKGGGGGGAYIEYSILGYRCLLILIYTMEASMNYGDEETPNPGGAGRC